MDDSLCLDLRRSEGGAIEIGAHLCAKRREMDDDDGGGAFATAATKGAKQRKGKRREGERLGSQVGRFFFQIELLQSRLGCW